MRTPTWILDPVQGKNQTWILTQTQLGPQIPFPTPTQTLVSNLDPDQGYRLGLVSA